MEGPEGFKDNVIGAIRRGVVLLDVNIQVVTTHKAREDLEEEVIKVMKVEDADQGLNVPDMDVS